MAKNTGEGFRHGSVLNRSQTYNPQNGRWTERDTNSGQFTNQKSNGEPFKGVTKEPDHRKK